MRDGERMNHNIPQLRRRVYDLALDFHRAYSDAFVAVIQQWRLEERMQLIDEVEDIVVRYFQSPLLNNGDECIAVGPVKIQCQVVTRRRSWGML